MKKLNHIGIAVKDLDAAAKLFSRLFGTEVSGREEVAEQKVRLAFLRLPDVSLELTEPTSPDSPISRFLEKRGDGIHHLSFEVDDIVRELQRLKDEGFTLIDERPRVGAGGHLVAFLHPKSSNGVLIEICQTRHA
jgi:methylmalonyl-CoA epimerase